MLVKEIMSEDVERLPANATLKEAAEKMKTLDVGMIPVYEGDRLVGMLSDRDITVRATAEGREPSTTSVKDVMTPDVVYCFEGDDIERASQLMQEHQIRRLIVLNGEKQLVGIISLGDIATRAGQPAAAETVEDMNLPGFRLHPLKGDRKGFWSVSVSGNWRIIFRLDRGDTFDVELLDYH